MFFNPDLRCKVCKKILAGDNRLQRRLNECSRFVKGGEKWTYMAKEYGFTERSLGNHLKRHQNPVEVAGQLSKAEAIQVTAVKKTVGSRDFAQDMLKAAYDDNGELKENIVEKLTPNALSQFNKQNFEQEKYEEKKDWMKMLMFDYIAQARLEANERTTTRELNTGEPTESV
jgi:hypothetical protein